MSRRPVSRRMRTVVALAAATALLPALALSTPAVAEPAAPASVARVQAPTPGAVGIGDPYYAEYGNGGYDVTSYKIKVRYTPSSDKLKGVTTIKARATKALSRFNLDLVLKASKVTVNGRRAKISQRDTHELVVTPKKPVKLGAAFTVVVHYAGVPSSKRVDGVAPWTRGNGGALAVGEPEIAAWWFPSNDHPRDKAKFDIEIKVPKGVEAISNGVLRKKKTKGKTTTWTWRQHTPMATYLAYFAAGQYAVTRTRAGGRPFVYAVPSAKTTVIKTALADVRRTPEVIAFQSRLFGSYPFGQIGGVVTNAPLGYALETQTRPIYDQVFWEDGPNIYVVVHENAHQWFGDSVSVRNWRDIWLNEGFATYAEWLWSEKHAGATGQQLLQDYYTIPANNRFWTVKIGNPGARNEFAGAVYDRGAMTLQALRNRIGDSALTTLLRTWVKQRRHGHGDIPAFIALAERISGQQLDGFFAAWLYTGARPAATVANGLGGITTAKISGSSSAAVSRTRAQLDRTHALLAAH